MDTIKFQLLKQMSQDIFTSLLQRTSDIIFILLIVIVILIFWIIKLKFKVKRKDYVIDHICQDNYDLRQGKVKEVDKRYEEFFDRFKPEGQP